MSPRHILERLIQVGARIDCRDNNGWTALHHASSKGWTEMARALLDLGAKPDVQNLNGETPLILATKHAHTYIVKLLHNVECTEKTVNKGANIDWKTSLGKTALMLAAVNSFHKVLELLIELGVDINCCDDYGCTALHHASSKRRLSTVFLLLQLGADKNIKNFKGETPLMVVGEQSNVGKLLFHYGEDSPNLDDNEWSKQTLNDALSTGWTEMVQWLVNKGANINSKTSYGKTALMVAAEHHNKNVVELLINSGADIKCCDDIGLTVMHYAANGGCLEIAQYLVNKGADFDLKSHSGATPLMRAVEYSHRNIVELLVNLGANIKICCEDGSTLLHYAASRSNAEMVQFLVNKGVDFDLVNLVGETPLLKAANASNFHVVELLVELGADVNCCNSRQWTLLQHASYNGWIKLVQPLIKKGININARMSHGSTPLLIAVKMRKFEMANHLLKQGADGNFEDKKGRSGFDAFPKVPDIKTIRLFIEKGACLGPTGYKLFMSKLEIQIFILKDVKLCSQIIINNFNNKDLPTLYKVYASAYKLPPISKMKISNCGEMALQVEKAVTHDIKVRHYCNVLEVRPLVLSILSLRSFSKYIHTITNQVL